MFTKDSAYLKGLMETHVLMNVAIRDNQPQIIAWNLAQLASALVPLMPDLQFLIRHGMMALMWKPFRHDVLPPSWLRQRKEPGTTQGKVKVMSFILRLVRYVSRSGAGLLGGCP